MEEGQVQPFFVTDNGVNADEVNGYFAYCEAVHSRDTEQTEGAYRPEKKLSNALQNGKYTYLNLVYFGLAYI